MSNLVAAMSEISRSNDAQMQFSPLMLADILISLAQAADQAGYAASAGTLLVTAYAVLDDNGLPN